MKILITGIAGFIGSHLADRLAEDHDVWGIDNFLTGHERNLSDKVDCLVGDIVSREKVESAVADNPDVVIHCAASYKDPDDWKRDIAINVAGTANVIDACIKHGVKKLVYFQTSLCYGYPKERPITLSHPINPGTSYAITKTAAERYIAMSGLPFVSFRLANIYGPRNLSGPVPTFYLRIKNGQKCTVADTFRDFVFVENLVDIVEQAVTGDQTGTFHISSGGEYSIETIFENVKAAMKVDAGYDFRPRGEDDVATLMLDNSKTREYFKYPAITPLAEGIAKAVEWYGDNEFSETFTHLRGVK